MLLLLFCLTLLLVGSDAREYWSNVRVWHNLQTLHDASGTYHVLMQRGFGFAAGGEVRFTLTCPVGSNYPPNGFAAPGRPDFWLLFCSTGNARKFFSMLTIDCQQWADGGAETISHSEAICRRQKVHYNNSVQGQYMLHANMEDSYFYTLILLQCQRPQPEISNLSFTMQCAFLAIIIIVFILQVIIGIIAFVFREETITVAGKQLKFAIREYANNEDIKSSVDHVQQRFTCCGLERPTDWDFNKNYSCANHNSKLSCGLPDSCCRTMTVDCGHEMRRHNSMEQLDALGMHTNGCTEKFRKWVEWHLDVVGATALGLALLHVLGIFLVYLFTTSVEDRQWLFKYRKRYYSRD